MIPSSFLENQKLTAEESVKRSDDINSLQCGLSKKIDTASSAFKAAKDDLEKENAAADEIRDGTDRMTQLSQNENYTNLSSNATDKELLALDAVAEFAAILIHETTALVAASMSADIATTEARLWMCRRIIVAAITSWREAIPTAKPSQKHAEG